MFYRCSRATCVIFFTYFSSSIPRVVPERLVAQKYLRWKKVCPNAGPFRPGRDFNRSLHSDQTAQNVLRRPSLDGRDDNSKTIPLLFAPTDVLLTLTALEVAWAACAQRNTGDRQCCTMAMSMAGSYGTIRRRQPTTRRWQLTARRSCCLRTASSPLTAPLSL